jgi:hypothetical protein
MSQLPALRYISASLVGLATLCLAIGLLWACRSVLPGTGGTMASAVYTVRDLEAQVARAPASWLGRRVQVRGIAFGCWLWGGPGPGVCVRWQPALVDQSGLALPLPLVADAPDPLRALVRSLPLAGRLAPPAQTIQMGSLATYRVEIRAAPAMVCGVPPCYKALLLDAAPDPFAQDPAGGVGSAAAQ